MSGQIICRIVVLGVAVIAGCGPTITKTSDPVEVTIKATSNGKPLNDVTLSLQPLVAGGQQAAIKMSKGEGKASVTPGTYTYYVETGKSEAEVEKIPEPFRRGDVNRKIEISQSGSFELQLN